MKKDYTKMLSYYTPGQNQIKLQYTDFESNECLHYMLWSGGCDSNLLLYELIDAFGAERVIAVSYKYPWLDNTKYKTEQLHREAFKSKIAIRGMGTVRHTEFDIQHFTRSGDDLYQHHGGLPQAVGWLLSIPFYAPNGAKFYAGYIKGDDASIKLTEYAGILENTSDLLDRNMELRIPYLYLTKDQILEKLIQYDLYEESWYCEMPCDVNKQCHECHPCITHISSLITLSVTTKDELVRLKAYKEIDRLKALSNNKSADDKIVDIKEVQNE